MTRKAPWVPEVCFCFRGEAARLRFGFSCLDTLGAKKLSDPRKFFLTVARE